MERIQKLTDIGFMFRVKNTKAQGEIESMRRQPKLDSKWENYFQQLTEYREKSESFVSLILFSSHLEFKQFL